MTIVYPTATGNWSTRTWNNDADGSAYGMAPQPGDIVLANGTTITIDQNITVASIKTIAGTTAVAGGVFQTTSAFTINADIEAGSTNAMTTVANGTIINGNCYGSDATFRGAVNTASLVIINGNCYGGDAANSFGASVGAGSVVTGNAYGGAGAAARGLLLNQGLFIGNSFGGSGDAESIGARLSSSVQIGDSTGGSVAPGTALLIGAVQYGDALGGAGGAGTLVFGSGQFFGDATASSTSGGHGVSIGASGTAIAIVGTATGNTSGIYGVYNPSYSCTVVIDSEVGTYAKSLHADTRTGYTWVPWLEPLTPAAIAAAVWTREGRTLTA